jgi:hypothetical protein
MTLTEAYGQNYIPGFDCRMATFRNNMALAGKNLSNGMVLGLSGCLTILYAQPAFNRVPYYTVVGITDQSLEGLSTVFDTYLTRGECADNAADVFEVLRANLANNIPVNAAINRPLLNYLRQGNSAENYEIEPTNLGFHYVSITDVSKSSVTFFETDYAKPLTYDMDTFRKLWFFDTAYNRQNRDPHQPCNGKYYTVTPPVIDAHKSKAAIRFAIDKVTNSFFAVNRQANYGVHGMELFFDEMKNWGSGADSTCIVNSLFLMKILESRLSGGGFGRRLYSSFLSEAAEIFNDSELKDIALRFRATSKIWIGFVNELCSQPVIEEVSAANFSLLGTISEKYRDLILDAENLQFQGLKKWCC